MTYGIKTQCNISPERNPLSGFTLHVLQPNQVLDLVKAVSSMTGPIQCGHAGIDLLATLIFDARSSLVKKNFAATLDGLNVALDVISDMQIKYGKEGTI